MEPQAPRRPQQHFNNGRHTNRRSNHIVRHRDIDEPVIPHSNRVARPVTVNTTPEQARQAAMIASTAFKPVMAPPLHPEQPLGTDLDQISAAPLDEPATSSGAKTAIIILSILVLLFAAAAAVGFYLALRKG